MKWIASCIFLFFCLSTKAHALPAGLLNVKDFGAKGDGVTDDTKSIQAAFDQAGAGWNGGSEVFFPYGIYLVSDELDPKGISIRGEGYAEILQKKPAKDIFHAKRAWRMTIAGLSFEGGKDQISLGNPNTDSGFLQIIDCRFHNCSGFAVEFRQGTNSTQTVIERCAFNDCYQVLYTATDESVVRDCWISSSGTMTGKAVIEIEHGRVLIENICGVPRVNGTDQRWIDVDAAGANLVCRNVRFGGEGAGFTPVVNFARRTPELLGSSITLENCFIAALGNNKRKCAVYCEELPNQIRIVDCRIAGVAALMIRPGIDLKSYFKGVRPGMLDYSVEHNIGEFQGQLPPLLKKPFLPLLTFAETGILPPVDTAHKLAIAARAEAMRVETPAAPAQPPTYNGHTQQTDPRKYQTIAYSATTWRLDDLMDGTSDLNSNYLAMAPVKGHVLIIRRKAGGYPHVLIKDVTIDLDKYPFLALLQKKALRPAPASDALKVIDNATGVMLTLDDGIASHAYKYRAFDLKKLFKMGGVRTFTIKYYYLGEQYIAATNAAPFKIVHARPGDYIVLDFIRAEAAD